MKLLRNNRNDFTMTLKRFIGFYLHKNGQVINKKYVEMLHKNTNINQGILLSTWSHCKVSEFEQRQKSMMAATD
jgi:hypothetical protein